MMARWSIMHGKIAILLWFASTTTFLAFLQGSKGHVDHRKTQNLLLKSTNHFHGSEGARRKLMDLQNGASKATAMFPRRDLTNKFKIYDGGFNITDKHYWSSVAFTGIWAFTMALVCFFAGISASVWYCYHSIFWRGEHNLKQYHSAHTEALRNLHLFCVFQFSLFAIISAGVIFWGSDQTGKELKSSTNVIVSTVDQVVDQVHSAVDIIDGATVPLMSTQLVDAIQAACYKLNITATNLGSNFQTMKLRIFRIYSQVKAALMVTGAMILTLVLGGLMCILTARPKLLALFFAMMTILLFASWLLSGVSFALSNVTTDVCQAMQNYENDSQNSSLAKILPCLAESEATAALDGAKSAIKSLISQTNAAIDMVNSREQLEAQQTGATSFITLKHICDPYGPSPSYSEVICPTGESNFKTFETDYVEYKCINDVVSDCFDQNTPIPNTYYSQFILSMIAAKDVYQTLPSMFNIMTCSFVQVAFKDLTTHHCNNLQASFNTLWIGFAAASAALMPLQVLWIIIRKSLSKSGKVQLQSLCFPCVPG